MQRVAALIYRTTAKEREKLLRFSHDDRLFRYIPIVRDRTDDASKCYTLTQESTGHWTRQWLYACIFYARSYIFVPSSPFTLAIVRDISILAIKIGISARANAL